MYDNLPSLFNLLKQIMAKKEFGHDLSLIILPKPHWEIKLPPLSADEWVESQGFGEWPLPPSQMEISDIKTQFPDLFGSKEEILTRFVDGIEIDTEPYDIVEEQIESLEKRLSEYSEMLLEQRERKMTTHGITCVPEEFEIGKGEINQEIVNNVKIRKPQQEQEANQGGGRAGIIQYALFPGFDAWELTPLPRQIEAPHILNKVTQGLDFDSSWAKVWKKCFLSQGSVALLQDIFWWVLMECFIPNRREQDRLYNRIADSYVSLFMNIPEKHKDFILKHYPSALAQSLYSTFCSIYINSLKHFDDDFKTFLCNLTAEWICGSTPPPFSWKKWPFHLLEPSNSSKEEEGRKSGLKIQPQESVAVEELPISPIFNQQKIVVESHPAGPGPTFERVQFNLYGRSPLVTHYLDTRNLGKDTLAPKLVSRTQIEKIGAQEPTYRQIINQAKKVYENLEKQHERAMKLSEAEGKKIQRRYKEELIELSVIQRELFKRKNEVRVLSEKLVDYQNSDLYNQPGTYANIFEPYIELFKEDIELEKKAQL